MSEFSIPGSKILDALQDVRTALGRLSNLEESISKLNDVNTKLDERIRNIEIEIRLIKTEASKEAIIAATEESRSQMQYVNSTLVSKFTEFERRITEQTSQISIIEQHLSSESIQIDKLNASRPSFLEPPKSIE